MHARNITTWMALILLLGTGCKTTEGPAVEAPPTSQPASPPPVAAAPLTCKARVKTLMLWVDRLYEDWSPISLGSTRLELVEWDAAPVRLYGPVLELEFRGKKPLLMIIEQQMDEVLKMHKQFVATVKHAQANRKKVSSLWPKDPDRVPWYIAADRRLSWGAVAYMAHVAPKKKVDTFHFLFWGKERTPAPPPSSIDGEVRELIEKYNRLSDPSAPAVLLKPGKVKPPPKIAALFARCPKVELSLRHRHDRAKLRQDLANQLLTCDCKMELSGLQAWLRYQLIWAFRSGPKSALTVRLAGPKTPGAVELTLPSDRPWQLAHKDLRRAIEQAKGKPLRLLAR